MKILKWLFLLPLILIFFGFIGTEINKAFWDYKVKKMCEKDGGVTVFETVILTKEDSKKISGYVSPTKSKVNINGYFFENETEILKEKNPIVRKYVTNFYRAFDEKKLSSRVTYSRVGGDFPTVIGHSSIFSCAQIGVDTDIIGSVFYVKGD